MYLLGFDIGSSSIKGAIVDTEENQAVRVTHFPKTEMPIHSPKPGWAEQDPNMWWKYVCQVTGKLLEDTEIETSQIAGIGISYQMHGLVVIDKKGQPVRHAIIWCDSRAVNTGNQAYEALGEEYCTGHLLNSPGNFTASKLKWVQDNEPDIYREIDQILLPGDFIAYKMTGAARSTIPGLSEGIFWDFRKKEIADRVLDYYKIDSRLLPELCSTFGVQGELTAQAAKELNLQPGIPVSYRAGDQPNNALSLGVFKPGDFAGTGGTSGVIFGISETNISDPVFRVNSFAHVNYRKDEPRIGVLLCINGAGIMYNWVRQNIAGTNMDYTEMEKWASEIPVGSEGLSILPFGNGAERMLQNMHPGTYFAGLELNIHSKPHIYRATLEGIAFAFIFGARAMESLGMNIRYLKVGNDNLFQSGIFSQTISNMLNVTIQVVKTTGAIGAAKAAGLGTGIYRSLDETFSDPELIALYHPESQKEPYLEAYDKWEKNLNRILH